MLTPAFMHSRHYVQRVFASQVRLNIQLKSRALLSMLRPRGAHMQSHDRLTLPHVISWLHASCYYYVLHLPLPKADAHCGYGIIPSNSQRLLKRTLPCSCGHFKKVAVFRNVGTMGAQPCANVLAAAPTVSQAHSQLLRPQLPPAGAWGLA